MARYGQEFGRNFDRWNSRGNRPGRMGGMNRDYGAGGGMGYGGMRSDGWGSSWREFPGEGGWFGGRHGRSYDIDFGGGPRGMRGGYGGDYRTYGAAGQGYETSREWDRGGMGGYGGGYSDYQGGRGWGQGRRPDRVRAADIMTDNPEAVTPDTTLGEVAQKMKDLDVGIIPVVDSVESRRLRGVITDRDIAVRAVAEGKDGKAKVLECMTADVETCNKNDDVESVLQVMQRGQVRRVPITDREGRLVGIIAQADLAVDYAGDRPQREQRVESTIERISEPARPGAHRGGMAARKTQASQTQKQGQEK